MPGLIAFL